MRVFAYLLLTTFSFYQKARRMQKTSLLCDCCGPRERARAPRGEGGRSRDATDQQDCGRPGTAVLHRPGGPARLRCVLGWARRGAGRAQQLPVPDLVGRVLPTTAALLAGGAERAPAADPRRSAAAV